MALCAVVHGFVRGRRGRENKGNRTQQRGGEESNPEHAEESGADLQPSPEPYFLVR